VLKNLDELKGAVISFNFYYLTAALLLTVFYVFNYSLIWQYNTIKNGCGIELRKAVAFRVYSEFGKYIPGRAMGLAMVLFFYDREKSLRKWWGTASFSNISQRYSAQSLSFYAQLFLWMLMLSSGIKARQ
jgi:hypothetical protein